MTRTLAVTVASAGGDVTHTIRLDPGATLTVIRPDPPRLGNFAHSGAKPPPGPARRTFDLDKVTAIALVDESAATPPPVVTRARLDAIAQPPTKEA